MWEWAGYHKREIRTAGAADNHQLPTQAARSRAKLVENPPAAVLVYSGGIPGMVDCDREGPVSGGRPDWGCEAVPYMTSVQDFSWAAKEGFHIIRKSFWFKRISYQRLDRVIHSHISMVLLSGLVLVVSTYRAKLYSSTLISRIRVI